MKADILGRVAFPPADHERWRELAGKATGGADVGALASRADGGLAIEPLHPRRADAAVLPGGSGAPFWKMLQRVDDPDPARAAAQVADDLEGGADGLAIVFEGAPTAYGYGLPATREALEAVLDDVQLARAHLRLDVHPASRSSVDWMVEILTQRRADPARISLSFGIDPAAIFAGTGRLRMSIEALKASMPPSLGHFFALGVPGVLLEADGRVFHNAGATQAQELGIMIASAVAHLRMFEEARQPLVYAAPHVGFSLAVDQDQYLSMAKIRALRKLWTRIQEDCSIAPSPATIHAETSFRMLARRDFETNILRNTIAAFAAAAGGADSLAVLPHTSAFGLPDAFARRIARNTQIILSAESMIGYVDDPAAGSGGIEALTDALCAAAWDEFRRIEAEGGILESLAAGHVQDRIEDAARARAARHVSGEAAMVGVTLYPPQAERPVSVLPAETRDPPDDGAVFCRKLELRRLETMVEEARP